MQKGRIIMNPADIARATAEKRGGVVERLLPRLHTARAHSQELYNQKRGQAAERQERAEVLRLMNSNIPGFFPTPPKLVSKMIELAQLEKGLNILEPSAGAGAIADAIRDAGYTPQCVEWSYSLYEVLYKKLHTVTHADFLTWEILGSFDRVLMNPPFEKGADIDHVLHAYKLLSDNGRIVAIMSEGTFYRSDKKAVEFRNWLETVDHEITQNEQGAFKQSGTMVNTRMIVINKG